MSSVEVVSVGTQTNAWENDDGIVSSGILDPKVDGLLQRRDNTNTEGIPLDTLQEGNSIEDPFVDEEIDLFLEFPEGGFEAWTVVFGAWCAFAVTFGLSGTAGFLQAYLSKNELKQYSSSDISWIFSINYFMSMFGSIQVGPLVDAYGLKFVKLPGCIGLPLGLFLLSICHKYYQFFLVWGILQGVSASLLFTPCIAVISHWFYKRRGLATGIAATGSAFGGMIFPLAMAKMLPELGYAWTVRVIGFLVLSLCIACFFTMKSRLPGVDLEPDGKRRSLKQRKPVLDAQMFKDKLFLMTTVAIFLTEFSYFIPLTYVPSYAMSQGISNTLSYQLLSIMNGASVLGRSVAGYFADIYGRFNIVIITTIACTISCLALWLPSSGSIGINVAFAVMFGFCSGTTISAVPVCVAQISKTQDFGKRYGTAYFFVSFGALLGTPVAGSLIKKKKGYTDLIIFTAVIYIAGTICFILARIMGGGWKLKTVF